MICQDFVLKRKGLRQRVIHWPASGVLGKQTYGLIGGEEVYKITVLQLLHYINLNHKVKTFFISITLFYI